MCLSQVHKYMFRNLKYAVFFVNFENFLSPKANVCAILLSAK